MTFNNAGYGLAKALLSGGIQVEQEEDGDKAFVAFTYVPGANRVNLDAITNDANVVTLDLSRDDAETLVSYLQQTILSKENN